MHQKQFNILLKRRLDLVQQVLQSKGKEYASGKDRLHNFKVAANMDNETPERALWGMLKKHLVSVSDLIRGLDVGEVPTETTLDEKLGDCINYFILLEALFTERLQNRLPELAIPACPITRSGE